MKRIKSTLNVAMWLLVSEARRKTEVTTINQFEINKLKKINL